MLFERWVVEKNERVRDRREFVDELPMTPTGKVRRNVLRRREEARA